jgi:hypothetical protein
MKDKTVYQTIIRPVVMQGLEVWTLSKSDENSSEMWERKILRRIFGPVKENGVWMIRTNQDLMNLCREPNIILKPERKIMMVTCEKNAPKNN